MEGKVTEEIFSTRDPKVRLGMNIIAGEFWLFRGSIFRELDSDKSPDEKIKEIQKMMSKHFNYHFTQKLAEENEIV